MLDKKPLATLRKYYLPYQPQESPSVSEMLTGVFAGVLVPNSRITHDEMISEIKELASRIPLAAAAKGFLYSLSSGDTRYRTAVSSLIWARSLPIHSSSKIVRKYDSCPVCGCSHGLDHREEVDWNEYGVFRYLPPIQYGKEPNFSCAEYVYNDLREFEKLPAVEPCEEDYIILNSIFSAVNALKPHNMDTALVSEIRRSKILNATGNGIHCLLGVLSICGILEGSEKKGYLHYFTNSGDIYRYRDGLYFHPLYFWRAKNGVNYDAVKEIFGSFSGDKLTPDKAVLIAKKEVIKPAEKPKSMGDQYFTEGVYCVTLTNEERRYLALNNLDPEWDPVTLFSVTYNLKKRTVLFYEGNTIVKVIYEEQQLTDDGVVSCEYYSEYDTKLETDDRKMLLPLTSRGRAKPVTPTNVMALYPFGCKVFITLQSGASSIRVSNYRNCQELAIGEKARIKSIASDSDFHEFMRYYISTCPQNYFERIAEIRSMGRRTVKYAAGDIFRCQEDRTHYTYGIILGKIREIEKWPELPERHSFRNVMTQPIIVRMYDLVTTDAEMGVEQLAAKSLRPPMLCSDNDIVWGTHKITAHKELEPDDIQFSIHLARQGRRKDNNDPFEMEKLSELVHLAFGKKADPPDSLYIEWGFATCEVPWREVPDSIKHLLREGHYANSGVRLGISGEYCGRSLTEILRESPNNVTQYELLQPENRLKFNLIMNKLGLPDDCTYDDFAEKFGGITRQRYIELLKERGK